MTKQERIELGWQLVRAKADRKGLNRRRLGLGHGTVYFADKDARRGRLDDEIARLEALLNSDAAKA